MSTNLYDLPKDMLVKLLLSIEEDTKRETEKEVQKRIREKLLKEVKIKLKDCNVTMGHCSEIECDVFDFYSYNDMGWQDLEVCPECIKVLCNKHLYVHICK